MRVGDDGIGNSVSLLWFMVDSAGGVSSSVLIFVGRNDRGFVLSELED